MKHGMKELALADAVDASSHLAKWVSAHCWEDLFFAMCHMADGLELCWKIRGGISEDDRYKGYPEAAFGVELATRRWRWNGRPWYDLIYEYIAKAMIARNSRHGAFDDGIPPEHVFSVFGHLFLEIEWAIGERLELRVPRQTWQTILSVSQAADSIERFIRCWASTRKDWVYLRCPSCRREAFDSNQGYGYCRSCFHVERAFLCAHHGKASLLRDQKHWLPTAEAEQTKEVCVACFETLARQRVVDLVFGEPRVDLTKQFSRITTCPICQWQCFDLRPSRCLLCGTVDESWSSKELERLGLKRCRGCQDLWPLSEWEKEILAGADTLVRRIVANFIEHAYCDLCYVPEDDYEDDYVPEDDYEDEIISVQCLLCENYFDVDLYQDNQLYCEECAAKVDNINYAALDYASFLISRSEKRARLRPKQVAFLAKEIASGLKVMGD